MDIAMVLPSLVGGGAERVFLDLAEGFGQRGHQVDLVVVNPKGILRDQVPPGARLVDLDAARIRGALGPLLRYLRRERPDVVLSGLNATNIVAAVAGRLVRPRVPVVVTQHNHLSTSSRHASERRDRVMPWFLRFAYPLADRVVAVSYGVADDLAAAAHLPRTSIGVVYNPVRFDRLSTAASEVLDDPSPFGGDRSRLLAVGRLVEQKNFDLLIRAMAQLPACQLVILGEGPLRGRLERLAVELGVAERVTLRGFVANPYPYFAVADVFVLCSRWEGLPTVLIEALAFPAAIVATDCESGPREILADGRWGHLVPPGDLAGLAAAVRDALEEPPADRKEACRAFELDVVTESYLALLSGLVRVTCTSGSGPDRRSGAGRRAAGRRPDTPPPCS